VGDGVACPTCGLRDGLMLGVPGVISCPYCRTGWYEVGERGGVAPAPVPQPTLPPDLLRAALEALATWQHAPLHEWLRGRTGDEAAAFCRMWDGYRSRAREALARLFPEEERAESRPPMRLTAPGLRPVKSVAETETETRFLITPEWLIAEGACREGRDLLGGRRLPVAAAFIRALDAGRPDWCEWVTGRLLRRLDRRAHVGFAARRARSVQHLWPKANRSACEAAVAIAERVAAGEDVPRDALGHAAREAWQVAARVPWEAASAAEAAWAAAASAAEAPWAAAASAAEAPWAAARAARAAWAAARAATAGGPSARRASWLEAAVDLQALLDAADGGNDCG
jgi:hypothetical protein